MAPNHVRAIITTAAQSPQEIVSFLELRKKLFVDALGWNLTVEGSRESDEFDTEDAVSGLLYKRDRLVGGFRALRCDGPYLARSVFPHLAKNRPYPADPASWEISRFGLDPQLAGLDDGRLLYSLMFRFAMRRQVRSLVAIADLVHERFLGALGIVSVRYGPPQIIGVNRFGKALRAVAGEIPLAAQDSPGFSEVVKLARNMEINDETLVLGRFAVPA